MFFSIELPLIAVDSVKLFIWKYAFVDKKTSLVIFFANANNASVLLILGLMQRLRVLLLAPKRRIAGSITRS